MLDMPRCPIPLPLQLDLLNGEQAMRVHLPLQVESPARLHACCERRDTYLRRRVSGNPLHRLGEVIVKHQGPLKTVPAVHSLPAEAHLQGISLITASTSRTHSPAL